jgi:hypothetical protein
MNSLRSDSILFKLILYVSFSKIIEVGKKSVKNNFFEFKTYFMSLRNSKTNLVFVFVLVFFVRLRHSKPLSDNTPTLSLPS